MAVNLQETLQAAESKLKGGKADAALLQLQRFAERSPGDLLALNRIGDLLARNDRSQDAIGYYLQIAGRFSDSGFLPKATAIFKKILRLDPDRTESLVSLGELYVGQKLLQEASQCFLAAAERFLEAKEFPAARDVYQRLVDADPANTLHRVRLAEALAVLGETAQAVNELVGLADSLLEEGKTDDAHKSYARAAELVPDSVPAALGLGNCLVRLDRPDDAIRTLEEAAKQGSAPPVVAELIFRYEEAGRGNDAVRLLETVGPAAVSAPALQRVFRHHLAAGTIEPAWERIDAVFAGWAADGGDDQVTELLGELVDLEPQGHVPALSRLYRRLETSPDSTSRIEALERLIVAHRSRSEDDEAAAMLEELRDIAPRSSLLVADTTEQTMEIPAAADPAVVADSAELPLHVEAPAVPLNRNEEEYVSGRLTQTEILEKYGLEEKALKQVEEITEKFPGHVASQSRRVTLLRAAGKTERLGNALVDLALARRASGDVDEARAAALEAALSGAMTAETRATLCRLQLIDADTPGGVAPSPPPVEVLPETPLTEVPPPAPLPPTVPSAAAAPDEDDAFVIDFDESDDEPEGAAEAPATVAEPDPVPPTATPGEREPSPDMFEEVQLYLDSGELTAAGERIEALGRLGFAGAKLEALSASVAEALAVATPEPTPPATAGDGSEDVGLLDLLGEDDDDLKAMTAALEDELFEDEDLPVPVSAPEQSLDDIFTAFKEHVQEQVDEKDGRTHYDLGIAYKEMGLIDEAISEFQVTARSGDLLREAMIMLAVCHREKGETDEAANWYREGMNCSGEDAESVAALGYELAEMLLDSGDSDGALTAFRDLLQVHPAYRDVESRIADLEHGAAPPG